MCNAQAALFIFYFWYWSDTFLLYVHYLLAKLLRLATECRKIFLLYSATAISLKGWEPPVELIPKFFMLLDTGCAYLIDCYTGYSNNPFCGECLQLLALFLSLSCYGKRVQWLY